MPTKEHFGLPPEPRQLFSIVRRRNELVALGCVVIFQADRAAISITTVPLPLAGNEPNRGAIKRLTESWHRLGSASAASEDTLYDLLVVLIETVPDLSSEPSPPLLPVEWGKEFKPVRATQAHPRAYKGTKYQPRKMPLPKLLDLRPYLHDPGSITESSCRYTAGCHKRNADLNDRVMQKQ
jgi:hypothetical protein